MGWVVIALPCVLPRGNTCVPVSERATQSGNALAAAAIALACGICLPQIAAGLEDVSRVAGRMDLAALASGDYLIDDSYNANPGSVKAAVDALVALPGKAILVLGDMGELGPQEQALHAEVGSYAAQAGVAQLLTVGSLSVHSSAAFGATSGEGGHHFDNQQDLLAALLPMLGSGVAVLVKGSRSARMENITTELTAAAGGKVKGEI